MSELISLRKLDQMATQICVPEIMDRVRHFRYLESSEEVRDFIQFCENSEHKVLRGEPSSGNTGSHC